MLFIKRFLSSANCSKAASRERTAAATTTIIKRYTKNHEWISYTSLEGPITLGISDYGQKAIGDLVYVEVCKDGGSDNNVNDNNNNISANNNNKSSNQQQEQPIAIVEGVKGATDVYCPFRDYKIIDINENVIKRPSLINKSPEEHGYLLKFLLNKSVTNLTTTTKTEDLLNGDEYINFCKGQ